MNEVEYQFCLMNTNGLHVRPASLFVETAMKFTSEVQVINMDSGCDSDGKSVIGMLMLSAPKGTNLKVVVRGDDCETAMNALKELVDRGFDEE